MIKVAHAQTKKAPQSTRYKDHLLDLLPKWAEFSKGNEGRKDIYISHKLKMVDELAKEECEIGLRYRSLIGQEDALTFMRAALMMHKFCRLSQEPFDGSFPLNCLMSRRLQYGTTRSEKPPSPVSWPQAAWTRTGQKTDWD